jgi:L-amino acid N-acyltransferase YncA
MAYLLAMIRLAHASDADAIAAIYAPSVEERPISFEQSPPTPSEIAARITRTLATFPWLVWVAEDEVQGFAYAARHRERAAYLWSVDVSVYVGERHQRRGIARGLYGSLLALLRLQGYYAAHAGIALPNPASVGFHEALGFRPVGVYPAVGFKLGQWRDVGWWQLPLRERVGSPSPPLALAEAQREPGWHAALESGVRLIRG